MADEKTCTRLERAALVKGGETKTYTNWELRQHGKWILWGEEKIQPLEDKATFVRLERKGDELLASVSHDGKEWKEMKALEVTLPAKLKTGVSAGGTSMNVFTPRFDQFQLKQRAGEKGYGRSEPRPGDSGLPPASSRSRFSLRNPLQFFGLARSSGNWGVWGNYLLPFASRSGTKCRETVDKYRWLDTEDLQSLFVELGTLPAKRGSDCFQSRGSFGSHE
jgi:hypothetical protein